MKVVINRDGEGIRLSYEGVMYYAKLKGIKLYAYVEKRDDDIRAGKYPLDDLRAGKFPPHDDTVNYSALKNGASRFG